MIDAHIDERRGAAFASRARLAGVIYLVGTLSWRVRDANALVQQPVDGAGAFRIATITVALALVATTMLDEFALRRESSPGRAGNLSFGGIYASYIFTVALSATYAVAPQLVAFRVIDLLACLATGLSIARWLTLEEVLSYVWGILLAFALTIMASAALVPGQAFVPARGGIYPYQLRGVVPELSYNSVGVTGLLLLAFGLASVGRRFVIGVVLGSALVLLAQYRTGYVTIGVMLVAYLILKRGVAAKVGLLLCLIGLGLLVQSDAFGEAWVRGEDASRSVETLSGRTAFWEVGIEVARRSPWIGTGMTSGTRYEVLAALGRPDISTIHSTWVEVYVGVGIVGLFAFSLVFLYLWRVGWAMRTTSKALLFLMLVVTVRSITGSTIELPASLTFYACVLGSAGQRVMWRIARDQGWRYGRRGRRPEPRVPRYGAISSAHDNSREVAVQGNRSG